MKFKALIKELWDEKYMFIFCFCVAFLAWQGIHKNIVNERKKDAPAPRVEAEYFQNFRNP